MRILDGRLKRRLEDNIKTDGGMEWIVVAQDRDTWWELVNAVMKFRVP